MTDNPTEPTASGAADGALSCGQAIQLGGLRCRGGRLV